jgi:hypothetical protein
LPHRVDQTKEIAIDDQQGGTRIASEQAISRALQRVLQESGIPPSRGAPSWYARWRRRSEQCHTVPGTHAQPLHRCSAPLHGLAKLGNRALPVVAPDGDGARMLL